MELLEYRDVIRNIFIILLVVFATIYYLKQMDPFLFPGLKEKFTWAILVAGTLTVILYIPYEKVRLKIYRLRMMHKWKIRMIPIQKPNIDFVEKEKIIRYILNNVFQYVLILFVVFLFVRQFKPTFLEAIEMKYLLTTVIVFGILAALFSHEE
jgi:cell division protein FtsW (lipid II flippase)